MIYCEIERISSLQFSEYVSIIGSYHSIGAKVPDYSRYSEEQVAAMRAAERFNPVDTLGLRFTRPFREFQCADFNFYMTLWGQYERHGTLPFSGCLAEQPAVVMEILNLLNALASEGRAKAIKQQEKKNGSGLG